MFFRCFQSLKIHMKATFFSKNNPNIAWILIWECLEIVLFDAQKMCYWITHWPTVTHDFFTRRIFTKTPYLPWNSWPMRFTWKNFFSGIPWGLKIRITFYPSCSNGNNIFQQNTKCSIHWKHIFHRFFRCFCHWFFISAFLSFWKQNMEIYCFENHYYMLWCSPIINLPISTNEKKNTCQK